MGHSRTPTASLPRRCATFTPHGWEDYTYWAARRTGRGSGADQVEQCEPERLCSRKRSKQPRLTGPDDPGRS